MNEENTQQLRADFPGLFRGSEDSIVAAWGFQCGDGWFRLIHDLCSRIETHCRQRGIEQPLVAQVKEKFGTLSFYIRHSVGASDEDMNGIYESIAEASERSAITCEQCGLAGEMRKGGWYHVACDRCHEKGKRK